MATGLDPARYAPLVVLPAPGPLADDLRGAGIEVLIRPLSVLRRELVHPRGLARLAPDVARDAAALRALVRRRGIGRRLLKEIENAFPDVKRFEAKTGHQSKRNLYQLAKGGYQVFRTEPFTPNINWVYLQKDRSPIPAETKGVK